MEMGSQPIYRLSIGIRNIFYAYKTLTLPICLFVITRKNSKQLN